MAQDGFKYFRSKVTGLVGAYPEHFGFLESLEEVSDEDAECIDCYLTDEDKAKLSDPVETEVRTDFKVAATPKTVAESRTTDESKDNK
jgi:hypothetical protein